jgi:hypothetical protein
MQNVNCANCGARVPISSATAYADIKEHLKACGKREKAISQPSGNDNILEHVRAPARKIFRAACGVAVSSCASCRRLCGFAIDEDRGN